VDKKLLAQEARRQKLHEDPEVRRQVAELEEKLAIQALVAAAEKAAPPATGEEIEAWYRAHQAELTQPERVRIGRILVSVGPGATAAEREKARLRAEGYARRLARGEPFDKVAASGDGPERQRGGEVGLLVRGGVQDAEMERAAFALPATGAVSPVAPVAEGFALLRLLERRPPRTPSLEEARGEVLNRLAPLRHRKAFDELLARLRAQGRPKVELAAGDR